jgi:hypothetical protein
MRRCLECHAGDDCGRRARSRWRLWRFRRWRRCGFRRRCWRRICRCRICRRRICRRSRTGRRGCLGRLTTRRRRIAFSDRTTTRSRPARCEQQRENWTGYTNTLRPFFCHGVSNVIRAARFQCRSSTTFSHPPIDRRPCDESAWQIASRLNTCATSWSAPDARSEPLAALARRLDLSALEFRLVLLALEQDARLRNVPRWRYLVVLLRRRFSLIASRCCGPTSRTSVSVLPARKSLRAWRASSR